MFHLPLFSPRRFGPALLALALLIAALPLPPAAAAEPAAGAVIVDALNLRAGAGLNYSVLRVLKYHQSLRLLGRSADQLWLEVRLPSGAGGWVYAAYVTTPADVAQLPVTEAAGGPTGPAAPVPSAPAYSLSMVIEAGQATVQLQRYPKNAAVIVRLESLDASASLVLAEVQTDAAGAAQVSAAMPRTWADGRPLAADLRLVAATADGQFSRQAAIRFYR